MGVSSSSAMTLRGNRAAFLLENVAVRCAGFTSSTPERVAENEPWQVDEKIGPRSRLRRAPGVAAGGLLGVFEAEAGRPKPEGRWHERTGALRRVATMRSLRAPAGIAGITLLLAGGSVPAMAAAPGSLAGTVKLAGPTPAPRSLPVVKHKEVCGDSVPDDRLVVGPGSGLRYAVVTIDGVRGGARPERDVTHLLDNRACRFEPHVQVAEVGQWLEFRNSDPILHNADAWIGKEPLFNVGLPPAAAKRMPLARPGLVAIKCDVGHTWMNAYVDVGEDPYHTVTDAYGDFEIRDVPPGTYKLRVWHEELGTLEQPLTITADKRTTVDVVYPAPGADKERAR